MSVSVSHLRSFWAVARSGGFSAAARSLGISQPTLTRQIREIEEGYGLVLFERNAKGIKLSPEGETLLPIVNRIFEQVNEAERYLKHHMNQGVRIAAVTTQVTTRMISALQSSNPNLKFTLSVNTSTGVYKALHDRECDIGILTIPEDHQGLSVLDIGSYPLLAVLPDKHPLIERPDVGLDDLRHEPILSGSLASQARRHLDRACQKVGIELNIVQEIDAYEMIGELVNLDLGIGVIGFTGIVEKNLPNVRPIRECLRAIPVHFACLSINRRYRMIDHLFNIAGLAVVQGQVAPFTFAGGGIDAGNAI